MKFIKNIVSIFILILYFSFSIFISILLLNKNEYGVIEINDSLILSVSNINGHKYKNGSLIIIKKKGIDEFSVGENGFVYQVNSDSSISVISSKIVEIKENNAFKSVVLENNLGVWSSDYVIGSDYKTYDKLGYLLNFITYKWIFFSILIVPCFSYLLYQIYKIVIGFDDVNNEIKDLEITKLKEEIKSLKKDYSYERIKPLRHRIRHSIEDDFSNISVDLFNSFIERKKISFENGDVSEKEDENNVVLVNENDTGEVNDSKKNDSTIGKNERNLVKKGLILREKEIKDLLGVLIDKYNVNYNGTVNIIVRKYLEDKYISPFKRSRSAINKYLSHEIDNYYLLVDESKKYYASSVIENLKIINNLLDNDNNIENVLMSYNIVKESEKFGLINNIITNYQKAFNNFYKKINSGNFELSTKRINNTNYYNTNVISKIKINKIYSDYIIEKTYNYEHIVENLSIVKLKIVSSLILMDMLCNNFEKKYVIYLPKSIYAKEKKFSSLFDTIDDYFTQEKLCFLITYDILKDDFEVIVNIKKLGYKIMLEINNTVKDINNEIVCIVDCIYYVGDGVEYEAYLYRAPINLRDKVIKLNKSLIEEVIIG